VASKGNQRPTVYLLVFTGHASGSAEITVGIGTSGGLSVGFPARDADMVSPAVRCPESAPPGTRYAARVEGLGAAVQASARCRCCNSNGA
jgi:hypothetical protein